MALRGIYKKTGIVVNPVHEKIFFDNHRQADQSEGDKKQENITADVFTNCVNKTNTNAGRFEDLIAALWTK